MTVRRITRWAAVALAAVSIGTAGVAAAAGPGDSASHNKHCDGPPTHYKEHRCQPHDHGHPHSGDHHGKGHDGHPGKGHDDHPGKGHDDHPGKGHGR